MREGGLSSEAGARAACSCGKGPCLIGGAGHDVEAFGLLGSKRSTSKHVKNEETSQIK